MFRFTKERLVRDWPAEIAVALDGGRSASHAITLDLQILDSDQYRQLAGQGDEATIRGVVRGWGGIGDEQGQPLPFSDDNRDALARHPGFVSAVVLAYMKAARGEAARKN